MRASLATEWISNRWILFCFEVGNYLHIGTFPWNLNSRTALIRVRIVVRMRTNWRGRVLPSWLRVFSNYKLINKNFLVTFICKNFGCKIAFILILELLKNISLIVRKCRISSSSKDSSAPSASIVPGKWRLSASNVRVQCANLNPCPDTTYACSYHGTSKRCHSRLQHRELLLSIRYCFAVLAWMFRE